MSNQEDTQLQRQREEQAARAAALADVLAGQSTPPPPGHARIAYEIAHSLVTMIRAHVEVDLQNSRFDPPKDPFEQYAYQTLYNHLQQARMTSSAVTGATQRLVSSASIPRITRRCPDCNGILERIRLIDRGHGNAQTDLEYTKADSQRSRWLGVFPIEGKIQAFMCTDCGRVFLYAERDNT